MAETPVLSIDESKRNALEFHQLSEHIKEVGSIVITIPDGSIASNTSSR